MRRIMRATLGLMLIAIAVTGSLMATAKVHSDKPVTIDPMQLTRAAQDMPVRQVNEPF